MGFGSSGSVAADARSYELMKDTVMKEVKELFRPEFINRVDELIVFHALTEEEIRQITGMLLGQVADRLRERDIDLRWDDAAVDELAREGFDPRYGARPLRRVIQRAVEDGLAEDLLAGKVSLGDALLLTVKDGQTAFERVPKEEALPEAPLELPEAASALTEGDTDAEQQDL